MTHSETESLQTLLAQVFEFSEDDLRSNRTGRRSAAQDARITRQLRGTVRFVWIAFGLIFVVGLVAFMLDRMRADHLTLDAILTFLALTVFLALVVGFFLWRHVKRVQIALKAGKVCTVKGEIRLESEHSERLRHWYICVADQCFPLERGDHRMQLQQSGVCGQPACLYYLMPSHQLLSLELLH